MMLTLKDISVEFKENKRGYGKALMVTVKEIATFSHLSRRNIISRCSPEYSILSELVS